MRSFLGGLRHYRIDLSIAFGVGAALLFMMGIEALFRYAVLGVLEISFSFDNAVVNAAVLATMSLAWQKRFMTWGILIAVVGMRFVFPVAIVAATAHMSPWDVVQMAVQQPDLYGERLHEAHPQIMILAGTYLLLIFLNFIFEKREVTWLGPIERSMAVVGKLDMLAVIVAGLTVLVISQVLHNPAVLLYGFVSIISFTVVNSIANIFEEEDSEEIEALEDGSPAVPQRKLKTGWAGFAAFLYLEAQDASFSFDGVSGAFAITNNALLIVVGLGIGALFVRSMTLHLLRSGALAEFRYLEHGAHWAIGVLAVCMLASLFVEIPEYVTGLIGVLFIGAAIFTSVRYNKRNGLGGSEDKQTALIGAEV